MDMSIRQPEMVFAARALRTRHQIESQLDTEEHRGVWSVAGTPEGIADSLRSDERFTPVGVAALLLWGKSKFGDDWFGANQGSRV